MILLGMYLIVTE
ncbi:hypothetical protein AYI69_g10075, partial [Smittium culicis]